MEAKYYVPEIENFHIGFECEKKDEQLFLKEAGNAFDSKVELKHIFGVDEKINIDCNKWFVPHIVDFNDMKRLQFFALNPSTLKEEFRVKHLDREDVVSENWVFEKVIFEDDNGNDLLSDGFVFRKDTECWFELVFIDETTIFIQKKWYKNNVTQMCRTVFQGTILNKSELRKIMKQLNIQGK